ncbi:MAG: dihydropteroate synthase [Planctomycetes bacterium]|nr:dihydropteroate synthase [Planctomycetota bacterium]
MELTSGPGYAMAPIERFLDDWKDLKPGSVPDGFTVTGMTLPQNPGGVANLCPSDVMASLAEKGRLNDLDMIPHLSCKDHNSDALFSTLVGYRQRGIEAILALTGDKPVSSKGVFDLEAVGLLQMMAKMNRQAILKAKPGAWEAVQTFLPGAAVSPFKYTEPSLMQQYYKMEKKIAAGAEFLITQVGWDWRKSFEMMCYLRDENLDIPVLGNVYFLTTTNAAPRLMRDGKLPGCYVSDTLFDKLLSETWEQHSDRAAQQVAMYRAMGARGVDIGGVHDVKTLCTILDKAAKIGTAWEAHKANLCFAPDRAFYLYNDQGTRTTLSRPSKTWRQKRFDAMHRMMLDPEHRGYHAFAKTMAAFGAKKDPRGRVAKSFTAMERVLKHAAFDCQDCGDCYLPENFGYCTLGGCQKGLANAPCGDATIDGMCGNDLETPCCGEDIYLAAAASSEGLTNLRKTINQPRCADLAHSSSILNYLFAKDHTMTNAIISIGEAIHASIPKTGKIMRELHALGAQAYTTPSGPLSYVRALIEDQAEEGADYLAINVDDFGEKDAQLAVDLMVIYVKLVRQWGRGIPVCIDSSDDDVLKAGLETWYDTDQAVAKPLVNSIKLYTMETMMPLKQQFDFAFVGLLVSEDKAEGPGGSHSVEELVGLARTLFDKAVAHGFKPEDIFFDSTVFPLAIDMPMMPDVPGYTYRAFETIKRIKTDPAMKGVHCSLGVSNCCRDLPARKIGICRAYVAKGMEYGLDAGIVNVNHHYGQKPADASLLDMVDAFAKMDGDPEKTNEAISLMGKFCASTRK